mgnify:CR=1 FL=1
MPENEECKNWIISNEYSDEIAGYYGKVSLLDGEACYQLIDENFAIVHRQRDEQEGRVVQNISFFRPYCFGLLQEENLEEIGVNRVRRISGFDYRGSGILLGFVDTGIDYTHPVFLTASGTSRVKAIWDQNTQSGEPPEGFLYGTEFGEEEIAAGTAPKDENGHGTFLAGIAGGKEDQEADFFGVAPLAEIVVVKLKEAKPYLKEYYCMPEDVIAFSEADVMMGVKYLIAYASKVQKPLVLCLGIGSSLGSHRGTIPLSFYLDSLAYRPDVCLVTAVGNEGNKRHHARILLEDEPKEVEINVSARGSGFTLELFSEAITDLNVQLFSPTGEVSSISALFGAERIPFLFDRSVVFVERETLMRTGTQQRIQLRFQRPSEGIWRLQFDRSEMPALVDLWLPLTVFLDEEVYFLDANPEVTLCEPANASLLFAVGGYSTETGGIAPFSSRGFTADGQKQPTLLAPAVNVVGPFPSGGYIEKSGTSIAAAYSAGCVALFMEYIEEYRLTGAAAPLDTVLLRNLFSLGARRENSIEYPNTAYGYGTLNLYGVFEFLRRL